ncbi:hypothetical protein D3C83_247440 [compost metagenome]
MPVGRQLVSMGRRSDRCPHLTGGSDQARGLLLDQIEILRGILDEFPVVSDLHHFSDG